MNNTCHRYLLPALCVVASLAQAAVNVGNTNVQLSGFLNQGYISSSGNNYPFQNKGGTENFREMAINATTTYGAHLRLGAQAYAQSLGEYGENEVRLDWALVDYNFRPEIGIRLGRIKYPRGLYGEALNVDSIRPFVFLPIPIYNPVLRDLSASFDGGMLYGSASSEKFGSVDYKVFYGTLAMDPHHGASELFNDTGLFSDMGVETMSTDSVLGFSLDWSTPVNGLKAHVSFSKISTLASEGTYAFAPVPLEVALDLTFTIVGLEYIRGDWTFVTEALWQGGDTHASAPPVLTRTTGYGYTSVYLSAARRFGEKWEIGAYHVHSRNRYPVPGLPRDANNLSDWALGVRYTVNDYIMLKLEGHLIDGYFGVFNTERNPNPAFETRTTLIAAKTTLTF